VTATAPARGLGRHRVVVTAAGFSSTSSPRRPLSSSHGGADGAGLGCSRAWAGGSGVLVAGSVTPRSGGGAGGGEAVEWRGASGGVTRPPMSHLEDDAVAVSVSRSRQP